VQGPADVRFDVQLTGIGQEHAEHRRGGQVIPTKISDYLRLLACAA
jgi:hypothetical protein